MAKLAQAKKIESPNIALIDNPLDEINDAFAEIDDHVLIHNPVDQPVNHADPIVPPKLVRNKPGPVRTEAKLKLHTKIAHYLFHGRRDEPNKRYIVSALRYAMAMNKLYAAATKNDPFADWILLLVEERFKKIDKQLDENLEYCKDILGSLDSITVQQTDSVRPVILPISFRTVYGHLGIRLLGKLDNLVRQCLSMKQVGMLTDKDWSQLINQSTRAIRDIYFLSTIYDPAGLTRVMVKEGNELSIKIATLLKNKIGDIPQAVLDGTRRGKFAPVIRSETVAMV